MAALGAAYVLLLVLVVTGPWGWTLNRLTVRLYTFFRYDVPLAPDWALPEHYGYLLNVVLFVPLGVLLVGRRAVVVVVGRRASGRWSRPWSRWCSGCGCRGTATGGTWWRTAWARWSARWLARAAVSPRARRR